MISFNSQQSTIHIKYEQHDVNLKSHHSTVTIVVVLLVKYQQWDIFQEKF